MRQLGRTASRASLSALVFVATVLFLSFSHFFDEDDSVATPLGSNTKRAYIRLARSHALAMNSQAEQTPTRMDAAQAQAARASLFADLRALGTIDTELRSIIDAMDQSETELQAVLEEWEQQPQPPDKLLSGLRAFYYGATFQFGSLDEQIKGVDERSDTAKRLARRMLQALSKNEASVLMLPQVAKKLAGPTARYSNMFKVDIDEVWGFQGPDQLSLVNRSGRALHNCTIVVFLAGKTGEVKQNVHFVEVWPEGSELNAQYQQGRQILDKVAFRQSVTRIERSEIRVYCDELTCEDIIYHYAASERDKDISSYLDNHLKLGSQYRPFSKGIIWDDYRAVQVTFSGLTYLPPGALTVTLRNGELSSGQRLRFGLWLAEKRPWIEFKGITWDPSEWIIRLEFDDTTVTRSYRCTP